MTEKLLTFPKRKVHKGWQKLSVKDFIAREEHTCDRCHSPIFPGDVYSRIVFRVSSKHLYVEKEHCDPRCPEDPWEEDEERRVNEEREQEHNERKKSKVA